MNTSAKTNQNNDTTTRTARAMRGALLATALAATAVGLATATACAAPTLQSLVPTPAKTQRTDGPDSIQSNGIHLHFLVNGSTGDVLGVYKNALEGQGWTVTVVNSGGGYGGGGATYTATQGDNYGVFTGGGYGGITDVDACAWPSKPSNTNCGSGNRR